MERPRTLVVETGAFGWSSASPLKDASWILLDTSGRTARRAREEGHFVGPWHITWLKPSATDLLDDVAMRAVLRTAMRAVAGVPA